MAAMTVETPTTTSTQLRTLLGFAPAFPPIGSRRIATLEVADPETVEATFYGEFGWSDTGDGGFRSRCGRVVARTHGRVVELTAGRGPRTARRR